MKWRVGVMAAAMGWGLAGAAIGEAPASRPAETQAAEETGGRFMRFVDHGVNDSRLEAAIATYENAEGVRLRLVSAVHVGEKAYYEAIEKSFADDDAVLYEMVKSKGAPPPRKGERGDSSVAKLQTFLKDRLDLCYQLDCIDYRRRNFVHADLDVETFFQLQDQRGESMATLMLQSMTEAIGNDNSGGDGTAELLTILVASDTERQLRRMLAQQIPQIENSLANLGGAEGSVILTERNKRAVEVLGEQLAQGKRKLAVFYGAAHMGDMEERVKALGFRRTGMQWLTAWDTSIRKDRPSTLQKWLGTGKPATAPAAGEAVK